MKKIQAFNARTQEVEDAVVTVDKNGEFVVTFEDNSFIKFPAHFSASDIKEHLAKHEEHNTGQIPADGKAEAMISENEAKLEDL